MDVKLEITKKEIHGINVVHIKTNNLMSYFAYHCLSGSYHENEENQGVSHYLEHMFFKGTEKRDSNDISDSAAILGAKQNAFTSELDTCYHLTSPSENYDGCIELLSDMMFHSTFPVEEIEKERTVIQSERKMYEDDPSSYYWELLENGLFNFEIGHPIIGTEGTINTITQDSLISFKKKFYGKNNIFLLVMTSASSDDVFKSCEKRLKDNGLEDIDVTVLNGTIIPEFKDLNFKHSNIQQSTLSMVYNSLPMKHNNNTLEGCLNLYLGGGLYGVLPKIIREELGLAYSVWVGNLISTNTDGSSIAYMALDEDKIDLAKSKILEILDEISNGGVDEKLFKCVKAQMLAGYCSIMDNPIKLSRKLAKYILFDFEIDIEDDYSKILNLTFDEFKVYAQKRTKEMISTHCWVDMSPEKKSTEEV